MSDLIERLRRYCCCDQQRQLIAELVGDMHEAADEIERLRGALGEIVDCINRDSSLASGYVLRDIETIVREALEGQDNNDGRSSPT